MKQRLRIRIRGPARRRLARVAVLGTAVAIGGCAGPDRLADDADRAARENVRAARAEALPAPEPFVLERPADRLRERLLVGQALPTRESTEAQGNAPGEVEALALVRVLEVAARNSAEYQRHKEDLYRAALDLDLERDALRTSFTGRLLGLIELDRTVDPARRATGTSAQIGLGRTLGTGAVLAGMLAVDLVKLLSLDRDDAFGILADLSVTVPLLAGAGREVVLEPLTQAERDVVYAVYRFERFKREFAVSVASAYYRVLQALDARRNAQANYSRLIEGRQRARRLADAGRLPEIEVDQTRQDELRARTRWIASQTSYENRFDALKLEIGLPADARIELDESELDTLSRIGSGKDRSEVGSEVPSEGRTVPDRTQDVTGEGGAASLETLLETRREEARRLGIEEETVIGRALAERLDLRIREGAVADARRKVAVAYGALRARLDLTLSTTAGERRSLAQATAKSAPLRIDRGRYGATVDFELPWERTDEAIEYRRRVLDLGLAERESRALEDEVKAEVRARLRELWRATEAMRIQARSVEVAERRVRSTRLFLEAGRAQVRDLLEAEEALLAAQNALTAARIEHRLAVLELARDTGTLEVGDDGLYDGGTLPGS